MNRPGRRDIDEQALVRCMLRGDQEAFSEFFDAYFPRLYRFALARLADPVATEDIVQTVLMQAMRKLDTWRGEASLFTWLCTFCRREIGAQYRRSHVRLEATLIDDIPEIRARLEGMTAGASTRPDEAFARHELANLVRVTLDYLPARYGDVLEWKYIEGLAVKEIAERLRATPKAAESLLTRARVAFRDGFAALTGQTLPEGGLE